MNYLELNPNQEIEPQIKIPELIKQQAQEQIIPTFEQIESTYTQLYDLKQNGRFDDAGNLYDQNNVLVLNTEDFEQLDSYYDLENWLLAKEERAVLSSLSHVKDNLPSGLETAQAVVEAYRYATQGQEESNLTVLNDSAKALLDLDTQIRQKLFEDELPNDSEKRKGQEQQESEAIFRTEFDLKMKQLEHGFTLDRPYLKNLSNEEQEAVRNRALPEMKRQATIAANYEKSLYIKQRRNTFNEITSNNAKSAVLMSESDNRFPSRAAIKLRKWDSSPDGNALREADDRLLIIAKKGLYEISDISQLNETQISYVLNKYGETPEDSPAKKTLVTQLKEHREKQGDLRFARISNRSKRQSAMKERSLKTLHEEFAEHDAQSEKLAKAFEKFVSDRDNITLAVNHLSIDRDIEALSAIADKVISHRASSRSSNSESINSDDERIKNRAKYQPKTALRPVPKSPGQQRLTSEEEIARRITRESQASGDPIAVVEARVRAQYEDEQERARQAIADNAARTAIEG